MLTEVGCIVAGIPLGYLFRKSESAIKAIDSLTMWAIYGLLFLLGVSLGTDALLVEQLGSIGVKAFVISISCVLGSAVAVWALDRFILKGRLDEG